MVRSEERSLLWQSLRERLGQEAAYSASTPEPDLPAEVLAALLGIRETRIPSDWD